MSQHQTAEPVEDDEEEWGDVFEEMDLVHAVHEQTGIEDDYYATFLAHQVRLSRIERSLRQTQQALQSIADRDALDTSELYDAARHDVAVTTDTGQTDAARLNLGPVVTNVDIAFKSNGSSTMTVEVSNDGMHWTQIDSQSLNNADSVFEYDAPWLWIRAHANDNLDRIEISAKGL